MRSLPIFLCMFPMAVARSSSGRMTKSQEEGAIWGVFLPIDSTSFGTHTKTAEPIEILFGMMTRVGRRYHVLDGGPDPPGAMGNFGGNVAAHCKVMGYFTVSCAKMAEPIDMPFWRKTRMDPRNYVLDGVQIPQGEGAILGVVQAIQKHWQPSLQPLLPRSLHKG